MSIQMIKTNLFMRVVEMADTWAGVRGAMMSVIRTRAGVEKGASTHT